MSSPRTNHHLSMMTGLTFNSSEFRNFATGIEVSNKENESGKVYERTKCQSNLERCKNKHTDSFKLCGHMLTNYLKQSLTILSNFDGKPLQYGRKKESQSSRDYTQHHIVNVEKTELVISKNFPFLVAIVDGLIRSDKCGLGVLEIKCPYNDRKKTPREHNQMISSCLES
ncbi:LOW QUALITY PROTEIN: hypothetical protein MAR_009561 [Mya arenaria]|uniref:YqaJ viral recombinase domain-containing protein n=1 Tax=Mya arenaria TaxID=6604 RepID=A0ABY7DZ56_MYAAR|nr:LOW QUALITY PROTEIN: hypothetical protein MAR_009561 [Mya arenaria]